MPTTKDKPADVTALQSLNLHPTLAPLLQRKAALKAKQEDLATALPAAQAAVQAAEQRAGAALAAAVDEKPWEPSSDLVEAQAHAQALEQQSRVVAFAVEALERELRETTTAVRDEVQLAVRRASAAPVHAVLSALERTLESYTQLQEFVGHCTRLIGPQEAGYIIPTDLFDAQLARRIEVVKRVLKSAQG